MISRSNFRRKLKTPQCVIQAKHDTRNFEYLKKGKIVHIAVFEPSFKFKVSVHPFKKIGGYLEFFTFFIIETSFPLPEKITI